MKHPLAFSLFCFTLFVRPAFAHPHVFIEAKADLVFDAEGKLAAIRHVWRFDEGYSAFATQGLDTDSDGTLTAEELKPLADINVDSLADFGYFTFGGAGAREIDFAKPQEYWLQSDGQLLTLYFTLPTKTPFEIRGLTANIDIFDPTYYVSFAFSKESPITLDNAPEGCRFTLTQPEPLDADAAAALAAIGPEVRDLPPDLAALTQDMSHGVVLLCP